MKYVGACLYVCVWAHGGNSHSLPDFFTGHIGIAVPDVYAACKLFEEQGVTFVKKPDDGKMCHFSEYKVYRQIKWINLDSFIIRMHTCGN